MGKNKVELNILNLEDIFKLTLVIPDYQRIYCWDKDTLLQLLDDLMDNQQLKQYRLGSVILNKKDNKFEIVDGQQRLVSLTLLLCALKYSGKLPLIDAHFENIKSQKYISYNYHCIQTYIQNQNSLDEKSKREKWVKNLLSQVEFSVLIISPNNLDLAFTFFSNTNSRGVPLSDFDLLKAHHLRFLPIKSQQRHLAMRWNQMVLKADNSVNGDVVEERDYYRTIAIYIYGLRRWLNKRPLKEWEEYHVKKEFESALVIDEIPPFGERFWYKEPIQGGSHFFAYVEHFVERFKQFRRLPEYYYPGKDINDKESNLDLDEKPYGIHMLTGESHEWFRDAIEALLFAYYLKFGIEYISEVLVLITRRLSHYRFQQGRIYYHKFMDESVGETEIAMIIDRASSPTFVLADLLKSVKRLPAVEFSDTSPIKKRYANKVERCVQPLLKKMSSRTVKDFFNDKIFKIKK
ncbi:MAG: DUF262 domain-containing protein [Prevotella sp.]|nr:DUF262 domain-containing protein [Prevotella sp.]